MCRHCTSTSLFLAVNAARAPADSFQTIEHQQLERRPYSSQHNHSQLVSNSSSRNLVVSSWVLSIPVRPFLLHTHFDFRVVILSRFANTSARSRDRKCLQLNWEGISGSSVERAQAPARETATKKLTFPENFSTQFPRQERLCPTRISNFEFSDFGCDCACIEKICPVPLSPG
jgi:hypothetical protein